MTVVDGSPFDARATRNEPALDGSALSRGQKPLWRTNLSNVRAAVSDRRSSKLGNGVRGT